MTIVDGQGAWDLADSVRAAAAASADPQREKRTWEHRDGVISSTRRPPPALAIDAAAAVRVYFDGGCQRRLGGSGALVFAPTGKLLVAEARYLADAAPTNNQAEA